MGQANFEYASHAGVSAGLPVALSIFADRPHVRATMREDGENAGFRVIQAAALNALLDGDARPLGEVVQVDCPLADSAALAALSRLDIRAAHCGTQLVVATTVAALDDVFGCLDQSHPQILVEPARADHAIALGQALARLSSARVRDLAEEDRLMLLRLTEQVGRIAERIDTLGGGGFSGDHCNGADGPMRLEQPARVFFGAEQDRSASLVLPPRPPLPDPRLVRRMIRQRHLRARFFDAGLFADPAWDILLDLTAARAEGARVSVTSLCIASGVPPTTALRWISQMTETGLLERVEDESDRRRAFIALSENAADGMARYFAEIGQDTAQLA